VHCEPRLGRPDQEHVGLLLDEAQRGELLDEPAVERGLGREVELLERLVRGKAREAQPPVEAPALGRLDLDGEQVVQELLVARLRALGAVEVL
jgi:hypothetical protein